MGQRVRQRTVTVHNQLSMDIAAAFSEVKQVSLFIVKDSPEPKI